MRLAIITMNEYVFIKYFLDEIFSKLPRKHSCELFCVPPMRFNKAIKNTFAFPQFFIPLIFKQLWGKFNTNSKSIKEICEKYSIPFHYLNLVSSEWFYNWLLDTKPDLLISIGCTQIFPKRVLEIEGILPINFHGGRLPDYRGTLAPFWATIRGDTPTLTWHIMKKNIDAGPILLEKPLEFRQSESFYSYNIRLLKNAANLLLNNIDHIYELNPRTVNLSEGQYYGWPTWKEWLIFRKKGYRLW